MNIILKTRQLAFSSSRVGTGGYFEKLAPVIHQFLGNAPLDIAFIPFASIDPDHEAYANKVRTALSAYPFVIKTVYARDAKEMIKKADVIMVGGGNTFKLLHDLYALQLMEPIQQKVNSGTPFIGWSAGSNSAGATICTSNDMPIIQPASFNALGFLPFQINPHYYNLPIPNFNGETRDQRLAEFLQLNPKQVVVALPEGTALILDQGRLCLTGEGNAFLFSWKDDAFTQKKITMADDLTPLLV